MSFFKKFSARKGLSLALVVALCVTAVTIPKGEKAEGKVKASVFDEIQKSNISEDELTKIADNALADGKETAEKINLYTDTVDYEAAVNYALTAYYENEDFEELDDFEKAIDNRSEDIVEGYKAAAKERAKGDLNGYEAGTVLVSFDGDSTEEEIEAVVEAEYGECEHIQKLFDGNYMATVSISLGQTVDMAAEAYSDYSITEVAAANDYMEITESASDYVNDASAYKQYYLDNIHVKGAWDYISQQSHEKVLVGVIDSGIQLDHPDLKNVISPYSADVTDEDAGVRLLSECEKTYMTTHGTNVAGVIAAEANNSIGAAGVASCYNNDVVEILAVNVSKYYEAYSGYRFDIASMCRALSYCVEKGVKVINYSGGGYSKNTYRDKLIEEATDKGVIFVSSAGNDTSMEPHYPSDLEAAISVVATDKNNNISTFSNYGEGKDIAAPGSSIFTTTVNSTTTTTGGTSFSAPVVTAVVAMMCSLNSSLNHEDVKEILADTAIDIGLGDKCANGLVDAEMAVKRAAGSDETRPVETTTEAAIRNLAVGKPVTVSSLWSSDFPATNIVDGDDSSKWVSTATEGQSVTIDLEKSYLINNIEILYDRYIVSGYQVQISDDGINWNELANEGVASVSLSNTQAGMARARYVRVNYTGNTSYVLIKEIKVWGGNAPEETTTVPVTTTQQQTTVVSSNLLEVIGLVVSSPADNTVGVVWGQDNARIEKGYTYNVYVNGVKYLSGVACNYYTINNINAGEVTVRVTAVLGGAESAGVTLNVNVNGTVTETTTEKVTTTVVETTTEAVTTTEKATTTQAVTTTEKATEVQTTTASSGVKPLEVIGAVVSNPSDNTVGIVWGQDSARIESGCRYNVYVNGIKYLSEVTCNYYAIENISAGNVTVKVTSVLGGVESDGVTLNVAVGGATLTPIETTTVTEATTVAETTTEVPTTVEETTSNDISETNIALNKTVYSSSNENDSVDAPKAFDGDMSTRWSSAWADNQWVYVDLGENYNVAKVKVFWEAAFATQFKIQVSTDAANWQDVATLGDTYCKDYDVEFTPVNARYVRMLGITRGTEYGFSIYEMEVYATEKAVQTDNVLLSQGKTVVASSSESGELPVQNVVDGDTNTRWSSAWTDNEWIYVDLGENKYASYVEFDWEAAYATVYQVQISQDGTNWTTVSEITSGQGGKEKIEINQNARYVKMQGVNRSTVYGYSLYEMSVYGY